MKRPSCRHQGFTLPELVVVSGTLALLSAASFPSMVRYYEDQKLNQASSEFHTYLLRARSVAQRSDATCGISINTNQIGPQAGSGCASSLPTINLATRHSLRDLCLSGNGSTVPACSPFPGAVRFTARGMLAGDGTIIYVASTSTNVQYCLDLTLALIRLGSRNSSTGSCDYVRS